MVRSVAFLKKYSSSGMKKQRSLTAGFSQTGWPSMVTPPVSGLSTPARIRIKVDFPAPFEPIRPNTLPSRISALTSRTAAKPSKDLVTFDAQIIYFVSFLKRLKRLRLQRGLCSLSHSAANASPNSGGVSESSLP